jgi:hypothetical protein
MPNVGASNTSANEQERSQGHLSHSRASLCDTILPFVSMAIEPSVSLGCEEKKNVLDGAI